jgi:hypothetical protein
VPRRRLAWLLWLVAGLMGPMLSAHTADPARAAAGVAELAGPDAPLTAVYVGNDPEDLAQYERWFGREADGVLLHTGQKDWHDWIGSIRWLADRWKDVDRRRFWSVPLIPVDATLADAAAGRFNDRYREAAAILADRSDEPHIFVRTGWEFNLTSQHWSAIGREEEFIAAYRQFVQSFREVSDRFVFEWCPNVGNDKMNPEDAYPGDDYVDVIGMDFYYDPRWWSHDPVAAWRDMLDRPYGLRWHQAFAASRGKPTSYPEWGVGLETSAPYVEAAAAWFRQNPVVYQAYWNSDAAFEGKLSHGRMPEVGEAYRRAFGGWGADD